MKSIEWVTRDTFEMFLKAWKVVCDKIGGEAITTMTMLQVRMLMTASSTHVWLCNIEQAMAVAGAQSTSKVCIVA